jgi:methylated-DNA-[protein]-cysteine S-methyltransferase
MTAHLRYRSPIGPLAVEASDDGVLGVTFGDRGPSRPGPSARARAHLEAAAAALDAYFAGRPPTLPALDLRGTPFQRAVWAELVAIPWGEVRTYGEMAAALGAPGAARAIGGANHDNPVAILVPCHRVVRAGGALGGYAGGLEIKRWLLAHETAHADALRLAPGSMPRQRSARA